MADEKKMVRVTIDGNQYEFAEGTTVLEAAKSVGIAIPHYCYHPGLSIAGACRMCLVEIEKIPKLQIACYMTVGDGMAVQTKNERVKKARKAMLEFHLVNHPLDCPVCDQAGECGLQIYYMQHGLYISRVRENKVKKTKKAVQIGPHVMLDQERCILCSRCVRFCNEVPKTSELGFFSRGDREIVDVFPGRQIDNPYSMNVIDICPVGALLSKEFRFKTRVWYLESALSVCPRCSRGCNIFIDFNLRRPWKNEGRRLSRLRPRQNDQVNKWWMCDEGRLSVGFVDDDDRIETPLVRNGGGFEETGWKEALEVAAGQLKKCSADQDTEVAVLVSGWAANEELYLLRRLLAECLPGARVAFTVAGNFAPSEDKILRKADKNPNTTGAGLLGLTDSSKEVMTAGDLREMAAAGKIGALVIFYHDPAGYPETYGQGWAEALGKVGSLIYVGTNSCATGQQAAIVLPAAAFAEREGTVTNFEGMVQLQNRAFGPLGESLPGWEIVQRLGVALGGNFKYSCAEEIFDELAQKEEAFKGLDYRKIGPQGCKVKTY
ncbi:MAG: molybdopterin-dependent oxidoreductase [Candidatus Glassbacteria bacterium]